jgi:hypothetical protein
MISTGLGRISAKYGFRIFNGGWAIKKSFLFSNVDAPLLRDANHDCQEVDGNCYGPFGIVAETEDTIYLIPWPENKVFPSNSTVYVVPKTSLNKYFLVQPIIIPTPTITPVSTQDTILTPTVTVTITP